MENLPASGAYIIACNHVSFIDPPAVGAGITRDVYYLARKTLFAPPVMDKFLPSINAIPVDQDKPDMTGLKKIIQILRRGDPVVLFPEGSRSVDGTLQPAMPGIGLLVAKGAVPVVPARIFGAYEAYPRGGKLKLSGSLRIVFGRPVDFSASEELKSKNYQAIGDQIMAHIATLQ